MKIDQDPAGGALRLTERQQSLISVIQSLDPQQRHTLEIECRGTEPWTVSKVTEHLNIRLSQGKGAT